MSKLEIERVLTEFNFDRMSFDEASEILQEKMEAYAKEQVIKELEAWEEVIHDLNIERIKELKQK